VKFEWEENKRQINIFIIHVCKGQFTYFLPTAIMSNADTRNPNAHVMSRHSGMPLAGIQPAHLWIPAKTVPE